MKDEEDIATYILCVDELVNTIRGLGEEVDELVVVQKILRMLPKRFNPKISALEERTSLDNMTRDQLHGTLVAYEMRIEDEESPRKEATFKASSEQAKKVNSRKEKSMKKLSFSGNDDFDEDIANFVQKIKRGTCKCKVRLPLKCFACARIGIFLHVVITSQVFFF